MRRYPSVMVVLVSLVLALAVSACSSGRQTRAQGQSPTPPPTPFPQYLAHSDSDAVRIATDLQKTSPGDTYVVVGDYTMANLTSAQWVRTTIRGVHTYFPQISPESASGQRMASTWDSPVWVFEFLGDFRRFNYAGIDPTVAPTGPGPLSHTLYFIVRPNEPGVYATEAPPMALSRLAPLTTPNVPMAGGWGVVHTILPGQSPQIDALRANGGTPAAGTPSPAATPTP